MKHLFLEVFSKLASSLRPSLYGRQAQRSNLQFSIQNGDCFGPLPVRQADSLAVTGQVFFRCLLIILAMATATVPGYTQQTTESAPEPPPGWWLIPKTNTTLKVGGYVKFDMIHDFNPIASPDFFDVSKIPTDGSKGESTHLNAKETRVFLDFKRAGDMDLRAYVEGDFYGANGTFRLRHAFVEIGGGRWLAGQWWSNFMDENIIPNSLDFEKPGAYAFARHPMFRFKQSTGADSYFAIAVEEPNTNAQAPPEPGAFESPLPDLTARYRVTKTWGHVQLSAFAAKLVYRYTAGGTDEVSLVGGNLSGQFNLFDNKDKVIYQVVYGPGVGRMRGGLSAGLDADGNLEALTDIGITVGLEHQWSSAFSSVLVYNYGEVNNTAGQPQSSLANTNYFSGNVLWKFAPNAFVGLEYLYGTRQDESDDKGDANRLQFSVRYTFN
jgi:hypothetical protein